MEAMPIRPPAVAGSFYPSSPELLRKQIEQCFRGDLGPGEIPTVSDRPLQSVVGLVCPHAGYIYSGYAAAHSFASLARDGRPDTVILIGPNHRGLGQPISIFSKGIWHTPLGAVAVDEQLARELVAQNSKLSDDPTAHRGEHSLEVQLPFLQYLYGDSFRIVPVAVYLVGRAAMEALGSALSAVLPGRNTVVIASTDFTHYESQESAKRKDSEALRNILDLNPDGLVRTVELLDVTMCGVAPVVAMLTAARAVGARRAVLNTYYTSGDVTGDTSEVVGYASVTVTK